MFYIWIENMISPREAMTLYPDIERAKRECATFRRWGMVATIRNAATGERIEG